MNITIKILLILLVTNLINFLLFVVDKNKAIKGKWRIPERVLLLWSFFAPFGGFAGMKLARHKTKHKKFTVLIPLFMVLHIALAVYLVYLL